MNSATRLYQILFDFKHKQSTPNTTHRWAAVFGCPTNLESVSPLLVNLARQLDEVEAEIRNKFDKNKADTLLELFPKLRKAICFEAINANWEPVNQSLTEAALQSLKIVAHDITDEPEIKPDDLAKIKSEVDELFEQVRNSDLKKPLKTWILNCLFMIQTAISQFKICGVKGLQDALIRVKGEVEFFLPAMKEVKDADPTIFQKLVGLLDFTYKATEIPDRCRKICESPITANLVSFGLANLEHIQRSVTGT